MATSTSLNLRALLKAAVARSGMDVPSRLVSGLTPSAKAMAVAGAAHAQPHGVLVYVVPTDADVEQSTADVGFFLAAIEGLASFDQAVLPFPSHEIDPYRGLTPHVGVTSARARALHAIARGSARVVIASAAALLPKVTPPERLLAAALDLRPGQDIAPSDLAELLVDAGFRREDPADEHGEFAVRGGIVDIFPAGAAQPVRLEFIGDTIETLRTYDPASQRSILAVDQISIVPLRDVLDDDRRATVFDYLARARESRVIVSERDEVDAHAERLLEQVTRSYTQASGDLDEGAVTEAEWAELSAEDDGDLIADRADLKARRSGLPRPRRPIAVDLPPPAELFADSATVTARLDQALHLAQLAVDDAHHIPCQPAIEMRGRLGDWVAEIRRLRDAGETTLFVAATAGRAERTIELLKEYDVFAVPVEGADDARYAAVLVAIGSLSRGFRLPDAGLQIYAETDVFEEDRRTPERRRSAAKAFLSDLRDLKVGDLIVHVDHGIGIFVGLKQIGVGDAMQEFLELRYAGDYKLFVPVERLDLVQKYTGATRPPVDKLGGTSWERAKTRVKKAMRDMAEELLKLYAARKAVPGHAFSSDSHWQQEFEDAFEYELTPDQKTAIADIKRDMESSTPMDRLLCGDVGYGKTEVAMRAAFKAVMDGKQVAFLAPTTVLAFQHQKTLKERFAGFPVRIDMVSRFRSKAEQREAIGELAAGKIDIIVGTHRLLSKDVQFRDLGLLVVDEEQRFGVAHKEKIKQLRKKVDVLTMSATPIPRTLALTLYGDLAVSTLDELPPGRTPIRTEIHRESRRDRVYQRVRDEVAAGRQAYIVYPLVEESEKTALRAATSMVHELAAGPLAGLRLALVHGRMKGEEKDAVMRAFKAGEHDVLVSTTVIEVGIDVPNATAIVLEHAERFGLAQLHQLRGRVGRGRAPGHCFLVVPDWTGEEAYQRLRTLEETTDGFRIAEADLALRGPGDFLGTRQAGLPDFRVANLLRDTALLRAARDEAVTWLAADPDLSRPESQALRAVLAHRWRGRLGLARVG